MSRHILSLSHDQLTAFDLEAFVAHAEALNQQNRDTFTTPFPKAPSRWLSHYAFTPHPIELTSQGDVDGGLSFKSFRISICRSQGKPNKAGKLHSALFEQCGGELHTRSAQADSV